jgi:hypothetical protein
MVYHAKGMAYKHVNIAVNRRDHAGCLVSNAISESNQIWFKNYIIALGEATCMYNYSRFEIRCKNDWAKDIFLQTISC